MSPRKLIPYAGYDRGECIGRPSKITSDRKVAVYVPLVEQLVTFNGITKSRPEWAAQLGITISTLRYRLLNWRIEDALTTPPGRYRPQKSSNV